MYLKLLFVRRVMPSDGAAAAAAVPCGDSWLPHTYTTHPDLYPNTLGPSVHECEGQGRTRSILPPAASLPHPAPPVCLDADCAGVEPHFKSLY